MYKVKFVTRLHHHRRYEALSLPVPRHEPGELETPFQDQRGLAVSVKELSAAYTETRRLVKIMHNSFFQRYASRACPSHQACGGNPLFQAIPLLPPKWSHPCCNKTSVPDATLQTVDMSRSLIDCWHSHGALSLLIDATIKTCVMSFQLFKNHAFRIFYVCNLHYSHHAPLHNAYHSVLLPANRASTFIWSRRRSRNRGGSVGCHLAGRVSSNAGSTRTIFPIMAPAIPWWSSTCRRCIMQPVGFYLQYLSNALSAFSAQDLRQIGPPIRSPATASCNGRPLILHPQVPSSGIKGTSEFRHGPLSNDMRHLAFTEALHHTQSVSVDFLHWYLASSKI